MNYINELLVELTARLPELEWKISSFNLFLSSHDIPSGLFRSGPELTGEGCINEIKADIQTLSQQKNERSAHYLSNKIRQKVNVLVTLCQMESRKNKMEEKVHFGIKMLSTRQQWIATLEQDIKALEKQQLAMINTLEQMQRNSNITAILSLQGELGEVEKRLTLARETLNQAIR
ncbi:primosomal replication protein PriC [Legionella fallonii]|uniref:Coiled-coil protein n=1 Tax=Legionella fallonii LLAP-10 TaxID=1212491 RepID=A0A098G6K1_9GAMM|nr:primosomal replication protein [Legionella fallonii]CEG58077.1 conserved protein of unknown function [Legionella fallonii LLAP-10]